MQTLFAWIVGLLIAGIIISPFFWLWFLKNRNRSLYIFLSSIITLGIFVFYFLTGFDIFLDLMAKISAETYYFFYDAGGLSPFIVLFFIFISPFIFTKILYHKFSWRSVIVSFLCSIIIFVVLAYIFVFVLAPIAFEGLLNNI